MEGPTNLARHRSGNDPVGLELDNQYFVVLVPKDDVCRTDVLPGARYNLVHCVISGIWTKLRAQFLQPAKFDTSQS